MKAPEILPPEGGTVIATGRDVVKRLARMFPKHAAELAEWTESYVRVFATMSPADVAATFARVIDSWTKSTPPRAGEFGQQRTSAARVERHPLYDDEADPCNGQLFLARLGWWRRLRPYLGDARAAELLLQARDDDECYRVFDQWRHGEPLDPRRPLPPQDPAVREAATADARAALAAVARKGAILRGDLPAAAVAARAPSRHASTLRAAADQHRAAFMGAETQRAAEPASPTARVDEDALI